MQITSTRIATEADAKAVAELANEHELSVDSKSSLFGEQGALEFIAGYIDPSAAYLVSLDGESGFSAVVNLHPDSLTRRCYTDVYAKPHVHNLENIVLWALELADSQHAAWDIRPGVNFLDNRLQNAWATHGFKFLRRYYTMRMEISSAPTIRQIQDVEIKAIDIEDSDQIAIFHATHQNSFSNHFGFAPRELDKWRELVLDSATDPNGVFIAFKSGRSVGFCQCNDEYIEDNKGFINLLGVTQENQGLGIGEALLQTGISHCLTKGYESVELNVDTGNESGALKLYEKVGFRAESSWIQLHRPRT